MMELEVQLIKEREQKYILDQKDETMDIHRVKE
jgi:hypothetical protein